MGWINSGWTNYDITNDLSVKCTLTYHWLKRHVAMCMPWLTSSRLPPAWLVSEWLRGGRRGNSEKLVLTCRRARLQSLDSRKAQRLWKSNPQPGGGGLWGWRSSGYAWLGCNDRTKKTRRFTVTFESLPNETPQHLPTVVAEGGSTVGVDHQGVRTDPDLGHRCWTLVRVKRLKVVLSFCSIIDSITQYYKDILHWNAIQEYRNYPVNLNILKRSLYFCNQLKKMYLLYYINK